MTTINTIGRITRDFELRTSEKSKVVYAGFSLAVNERNGKEQTPMFFDCIVFGNDAERLVKAKAKKGSLIHVTGKFSTSKFTRNNGESGCSLKISVHAWSYVPGAGGQSNGANNGSDNGAGNAPQVQSPAQAQPAPQHIDPYFDEMMNLDEDDLLF